MKKSKLVVLLKSLTPQEFKQFHKYIRSPFFTQSKDVLKLYNYLRKHYPNFDSANLNRETIFAKLYPNEKFNGSRLRNLILKITKILEDFLIYINFKQDTFQKEKVLAEIYGKRNLNVIFKKKTENLLAELEQLPFRDSDYYINKYALQRDYYFHLNTPRQGAIKKMINDAYADLNHFFALEQQLIKLELKTREKIFSEIYHNIQPKALNLILAKESKVYELFKKIIDLIDKQEEENYFETKALFLTNMDALKKENQLRILVCLLNFALNQTTQKGAIFIEEAFELYKVGLALGTFMTPPNLIPGMTFLNIITVSASLKEFDWAKAFIDKYETALDSEVAHVFKPISLANLHFYQGKFGETIQIINSNKLTDSILSILARLLVLRSFYELSLRDQTYAQSFYAYLNSFEKYLTRERKLNSKKVKGYTNFIFIFKKLIKIKTKRKIEFEDISFLEQHLSTLKPISAKSWLQEKLVTLKRKGNQEQ